MTTQKDHTALASAILKNIGGAENVNYFEHCSTRLRFTLHDNGKANIEALKATPGVMSVIVNAQFQVVIGNDVVEVYNEVLRLGHLNSSTASSTVTSANKRKVGDVILDFMIGVFNPLVPVICGTGVIKAVLTLFTTFGLVSKDAGLHQLFSYVAEAGFYFLPIMVAYTTAAKLRCNQLVAVAAVGLSILPKMTAAMEAGITVFGLTVPNYTYSSQIFPAILTVFLLKAIEYYTTKICPKPVRMVIVPVVCMFITAPISMLFLSPLGFKAGELFTNALLAMHETVGWIVVAILGAILPFLTAAGMHKPLVPYATAAFSSVGYEMINAPAKVAHNISEAGACFAVALKSKDEDLRSAALSAGISAFVGISEPALYGVTLQNKKALCGVVISGFISAAFMGIAEVRSVALMGTGILGLPQFIDAERRMNFISAVIGYILALSVSFLITFFLYRDESCKAKTPQNVLMADKEA